jgi:D-proline reductase (dithiol) PrdB
MGIEPVKPTSLPVPYMARTRAYYRALGYQRDYVWATYAEVPFLPLAKPISELKLALVTTANPLSWVQGQSKAVWSGSTATPPTALQTADLAWDKHNTHTNDVESFLPIRALQGLVSAGELGALSARYYGLPSEYSQAKTLSEDVPGLLSRLSEDGVDAVLLVPL